MSHAELLGWSFRLPSFGWFLAFTVYVLLTGVVTGLCLALAANWRRERRRADRLSKALRQYDPE